MLVVLSDLHFQETGDSGAAFVPRNNVQPAAFAHLWRHVWMLADQVRAREPPTIVLNGDTLEILRSERWFGDGTRPYNFAGALPDEALDTACDVGEMVLDENAEALAALAGDRSAPARFVVIYGNHDRLLREDRLAGVRERFARALGGNVRFVDQYNDERHRVVAQHGHELDWTCSEFQYAREFEGLDGLAPERRSLAPLGDWVALEIGTRMPHLAWQMLSSSDSRWRDLPHPVRREIYERLLGLEDLRPQAEVLRWLVRPTHLLGPDTHVPVRAAISRFLGDLMNELVTLAMPHAEPWLDAHHRPLFDRLALGAVELLGSTAYTAAQLPSLMERMQSYLYSQDPPYRALPRLPEFEQRTFRFFTSGHTHDPMIMPLRENQPTGHGDEDDGVHWYLNTGTWRQSILRSPLQGVSAYAAVKQVAFAVFFDEEEAERATGHRAVRFDFWQGASQRF